MIFDVRASAPVATFLVVGDFVAFDVIDQPDGGAEAALAELAALAERRPAGCKALLRARTMNFVPRMEPDFTPDRVAVVGAWDGDHEASRLTLPKELGATAREHWHVRGELTRATGTGPWRGWEPTADGNAPSRGGEPQLVMISGELRMEMFQAFQRSNIPAIEQALAHPGYLGGLGIATSPANTTSVSAWRTAKESRQYGFGAGAHAEAIKRDREQRWHPVEQFLRIRPTLTYGTLQGRNPFAGLVPTPEDA